MMAACPRGTGPDTGGLRPDGAARPAAKDTRPAPRTDAWHEQVACHEPQSPLRITFTRPPATLWLSGIIDESTYEFLSQALARVGQSPEHVLFVDMSRVEFCDVAGLRAIISLGTRPGGPQQVTLLGVPAETRTLMHILGWHTAPGVTLTEPPRHPSLIAAAHEWPVPQTP
jgi:anti-anti-sigma regulatory factor